MHAFRLSPLQAVAARCSSSSSGLLASASVQQHARTYFSRPTPTLTVEKVAIRSLSPRNRTRATVPEGHQLTEFERVAAGLARRQGFLWSRHNCGQSAANAHFTFCCHTRVPYIAAARDGSELVVDLRPVGGIRKVKRDGDMDSVLSAFQSVLSGASRVQVSNADTLQSQAEKASTPGPMHGSNDGRIPDTNLSDTFVVFTPGRGEGLALAGTLAETYRRVLGRLSGHQMAEMTTARHADHVTRHNAIMVRRLRKLVADPIAVKNLRVKAGAVDGFVAALQAGTADTVPPK